ncbi:MAG: ACP S-malonyltransferase [Thermovirgaceae bacterium]|jgi:[acyl-carrier-protein] S-malonyltransferase|nr:ACP S-malonyltransferase [Synergistales bacterium]MDI9392096.1 ACP S-malonyltransferase [Synergistota bacterium]MDY0178677.1 ACP S-malonyltransferase [Synergistaceae bacterium]HRW87508.1 ACP S-malonyltransferase [Thermovirgaceae bacterium]MDD3134263.1 ACP S-malonyltransferase [Synergistales bacterium]
MKYAIVFPGQGAQEVGMGRDLFESFVPSRSVFERSDEALGFSLSRIIFAGPDDELKKTEYAQPAILTMSMAVHRCLEEETGVEFAPEFVAGHSLGEYTALVASGTLSLEDGVRLVHLRGKLMQEAVPLGKGSMAAIIGLDRESVISICEEVSSLGVCQAANFNAPGQIVISGEREAVDKAVSMCKDAGAKRALPLKVSAPFHCSLMRPVADRLRESFSRCSWNRPKWPLIANVSAGLVSDVESIQEALFLQTFMPVLWSGSIELMISRGVRSFLEVGPGSVLSGLIKRISADSRCLSVNDHEGIREVIDFLKGGQYDES